MNVKRKSEAVSEPDVKYNCGTSFEECVSEHIVCACFRASRNAELLERAEKLNVEISVVLSLREGSFLRLYL